MALYQLILINKETGQELFRTHDSNSPESFKISVGEMLEQLEGQDDHDCHNSQEDGCKCNF